jgi:protein tyrosine/serine phosphatase
VHVRGEKKKKKKRKKKSKYSILIASFTSSGIHETGTLVGCLRKLEGWNFSSIVTEVNDDDGYKKVVLYF